MQLGVLFVGLVMAAATLLTIDLKLAGGLIPGSAGWQWRAPRACFTMLVLAQLFKCLNSRSERESAFRGIFGNPLRWVAIVVSLAPQVLVVHVPLFNDAFTATPLSAGEWALCAGMASSVLWIDELKKLIVRRRHGRADE